MCLNSAPFSPPPSPWDNHCLQNSDSVDQTVMCMWAEVRAGWAPRAPWGEDKESRRGASLAFGTLVLPFFLPNSRVWWIKIHRGFGSKPKAPSPWGWRQRGDLHCFFGGGGTGSGIDGEWFWCSGHSTLQLVPVTPLSQHRPASALHLHPINSPDQKANIPGEDAPLRSEGWAPGKV